MKSLQDWMEHYSSSHQNQINKNIHKICVPIINFTLIAFLWCLPVPDLFINRFILFNWAVIGSIFALIFYFQLSTQAFTLMFFKLGGMIWLCSVFSNDPFFLYWCFALFILSWIGQFLGHKIEGKKPSFFEDLQFLMIGPLWVLRAMTGYPSK